MAEDPVSALPGISLALKETVKSGAHLADLGERKHLEPIAAAELLRLFPLLAEKDRKVRIPGWPNVGNVDAVVRVSPGSDRLRFLVELKWCPGRRGILYEAIWDLFKMALGSTRPDVEAAYLVTGAPITAWATDFCRDLFESAEHSPIELCARRFPSGRRRLAWDDLLEGGYDRYPRWVPAAIGTEVVGSAEITDDIEQWEIRAIRVTSASHERVPFSEGWPFGDRPPDARRPALAV